MRDGPCRSANRFKNVLDVNLKPLTTASERLKTVIDAKGKRACSVRPSCRMHSIERRRASGLILRQSLIEVVRLPNLDVAGEQGVRQNVDPLTAGSPGVSRGHLAPDLLPQEGPVFARKLPIFNLS